MMGETTSRGRLVPLLLLASLGVCANGFCYRKNPPKPQDNAEQLLQPGNYSIWLCVQSKDLAADLEKAPKANITQITFSMSHVDKLKNDAFTKFAEKLAKLEIWGSKLAEIEDGALKGLKELNSLQLPRNELTVLKSAWFKDTPKLLELGLANNRIQSMEIEFLKLVPALVTLDLRGNELVAVPADFVKQLPASLKRMNLYNNPLNYHQMMEIVTWSQAKEDKSNEIKMKELKHVMNVTKNCLEDKAMIDKSNDAIDKCVEEKLNNDIVRMVANATATAA